MSVFLNQEIKAPESRLKSIDALWGIVLLLAVQIIAQPASAAAFNCLTVSEYGLNFAGMLFAMIYFLIGGTLFAIARKEEFKLNGARAAKRTAIMLGLLAVALLFARVAVPREITSLHVSHMLTLSIASACISALFIYLFKGKLLAWIALALMMVNYVLSIAAPFMVDYTRLCASVAIVNLGAMSAGMLIQEQRTARVRQLAIFGAIFLALGILWATVDSISAPKITTCYALICCGLAALLLALLEWASTFDAVERMLVPLEKIGSNPLASIALIVCISLIFGAIPIRTTDQSSISLANAMCAQFRELHLGAATATLIYTLFITLLFALSTFVLHKAKTRYK